MSPVAAARETFSSRWGLVLATLGMAVGTGNIWRFPRVVASNDGGSFLVAWVVFLLLWSVPLMIVEFAFGKRSRRGTVGAFAALAGRKSAWMGAWVALCATGIMFYYAVVSGWCLRYLAAALTGELAMAQPAALWDGFAGSPAAVLAQAAALGLAFAVVWFGVRGIERVAKLLIPVLAVLVVVELGAAAVDRELDLRSIGRRGVEREAQVQPRRVDGGLQALADGLDAVDAGQHVGADVAGGGHAVLVRGIEGPG
jgi:NSS family neurotransmitter:Na+ symporter